MRHKEEVMLSLERVVKGSPDRELVAMAKVLTKLMHPWISFTIRKSTAKDGASFKKTEELHKKFDKLMKGGKK